ncbi:MAG: GNAT family N-acetyltransferase/peptidase C39 family protein [Candidatus Omnitrophica bacterium]|nr:GNAT family N-acetyltransferase/peptidase C39 family protein [Candidatus Omnitrophota bacterium]
MKRKYYIRLATEHDLDALVRLEEVAFETDRFTKDQIDYLLTESRATNFVLMDKSCVAGASCVLWRKSQQVARLYNIAIDPAFQGKGFGVKLLKECELEAVRRSCKKMTLEVRADNEGAIRFYDRQGYVILRSMPDYYSDGMAGIKMMKVLDLEVPWRLKHNVPYYAQTLDFTCGPACLMMTLKHFYPQTELTRALEMTLWKDATLIFMASGFGGTDGYGLALSALTRGLECHLVMSMDSTPLLKSVRIAKKREVMKIVHTDLKRRARRKGLGSAFYEFGIDEIISALQRGMLPIVMISTYRLTGDRVPHWVVVTGFDKDSVYIHDPDVASYKRNRSRARHLRIEKSEFLRMSRYGKEVYRCLLMVGPGRRD